MYPVPSNTNYHFINIDVMHGYRPGCMHFYVKLKPHWYNLSIFSHGKHLIPLIASRIQS